MGKLTDHTYASKNLTYFESDAQPYTGTGNFDSCYKKIRETTN